MIKTHTIEGQRMLDRVGGLLGRVGEIVRSRHERWDGNGYPDGLAGEEIPLAARIVCCCDAYNAMTTDRPYREALSHEVALAELRRQRGHPVRPRVVAALACRIVERGGGAGTLPRARVRTVLAGTGRDGRYRPRSGPLRASGSPSCLASSSSSGVIRSGLRQRKD